MVRRAAGRGTSLSSTSVMIPSVPSDPTNRSFIEYPATSFTHWLPNRAIRPSASTTSSAMT